LMGKSPSAISEIFKDHPKLKAIYDNEAKQYRISKKCNMVSY
jgi:hypothetical protein